MAILFSAQTSNGYYLDKDLNIIKHTFNDHRTKTEYNEV